MFGRRIHLFDAFGFPIHLDPSWFFVALLFSWSFATNLFPGAEPGLGRAAYWVMGVVATLGLFASVVLHELSHAVTARRFGIPMRGVTLFFFGGVAEMSGEPPSARSELWMALAGPIASVLIGLACGAAAWLGATAGLPSPATAVLRELAFINLGLALFNLLPAFPLDGGRVFRALLWGWKGNLRQATRLSSRVGSLFGLAFIALGLVAVLVSGNLFAGVWWFLLGLFLRNAAQMSYQQLLLRRALEGETVSRFMHPAPVTVPRSLSVAELVDGYIYRHHFKMFPVVDDAGRLFGCVSTREVKELPRDEWDRQTVGAIAHRCGPESTVSPDTDAMKALSQMSRTGASRLMVVDGDRLLGILTLKDLLRFFSLKMELEQSG
jgi:Zn-dependent protease/CBS domain-containing protein